MQRHAKAFTLIELLIATAISAIVMLATGAVISAGLRTFASVSAAGGDELLRVRLVSALEQDIASAMPLGGMKFEGEGSRMSFPRMVSFSHSTNATAIVKIQWGRDVCGGIVRTLTRADETQTKEDFGRSANFRIAYAGGGDGADRLPSRTLTWTDDWTRDAFPGIVRVDFGDFTLASAVMCSEFALETEDGK